MNCQRQTGSAFVINALIEADRVELLQGAPRRVPVPRDEPPAQELSRCDMRELWPAASLERLKGL